MQRDGAREEAAGGDYEDGDGNDDDDDRRGRRGEARRASPVATNVYNHCGKSRRRPSRFYGRREGDARDLPAYGTASAR